MRVQVLIGSLLIAASSSAFAQPQTIKVKDATITIEPFTAFYGENQIVFSGGERPVIVPHHIGCDAAKNLPNAIQAICGPNRKGYYTSVGSVGDNRCGYTMLAGVCIAENP